MSLRAFRFFWLFFWLFTVGFSRAVLPCASDLKNVEAALKDFPDFDFGSPENWAIIQRQFEEVELEGDKTRFSTALGPAMWKGETPLLREDWHLELLESWGVSPMTYQSEFIFGVKRETSLKKVCASIYAKMKEFVAQDILEVDEAAFLSLHLRITDPLTKKQYKEKGLPTELHFRPGVDPWPNLNNYRVYSFGLVSHIDWILMRATGHMPFDFLQWDHDLSHPSTYVRFPKYFARLQKWYREQARFFGQLLEPLSTAREKYFQLAANLIDESGCWIDQPAQVESFKQNLPSGLNWSSFSAELISKLSVLEREAWAARLLKIRDVIMTRHGALDLQLNLSPNQPEIVLLEENFRIELARVLYPNESDSDFPFSFASSLPLLITQMQLLERLAPDQVGTAVVMDRGFDGGRLPRTKDIQLAIQKAAELKLELMTQMLIRFALGYRAFVSLQMSPLQMLEDFKIDGLDPQSITASYLKIFHPQNLQTLEYYRQKMR